MTADTPLESVVLISEPLMTEGLDVEIMNLEAGMMDVELRTYE